MPNNNTDNSQSNLFRVKATCIVIKRTLYVLPLIVLPVSLPPVTYLVKLSKLILTTGLPLWLFCWKGDENAEGAI